ncbi:ras-related protein Rac1-like [Symsagittifera roscoffensis]|uniref:ras-related protein Rac1-like n=1 Tax=Symsagittifera roscoffensis TaxID=84072 RepID=UPI00307C079F
MHQFKCVVVGDGFVGKTSMLIAYTRNYFDPSYTPTVFENHNANILVNGIPYILQLWDTAGQEDYDRLRPLSYPMTHIFLMCFSFDRMDTVANLKSKWEPEVKHHCPNTPILLIGTKLDLKKTNKEEIKKSSSIVTTKTGKALEKSIGACGYVECSAKTKEGITLVFEKAVTSCISKTITPKKRPCRIL